jgi:SPP1 gp7 family putative phage head morphogenesis protein
MEDLAQRYVLSDRPMSRWVVAQMTVELESLARHYALETVRGPYGQMIIDAAQKGIDAKLTEASLVALSPADIDVVLQNANVHIKDITTPIIKKVNETVMASNLVGTSQTQLAREIRTLMLSEGMAASKVRATMIARSELMSAYRQGALLASQAAGYTHYQYVGPNDSKISKICKKYVGQIKTMAEWLKIHILIAVYGLHPNCRHRLDPVEAPMAAVA